MRRNESLEIRLPPFTECGSAMTTLSTSGARRAVGPLSWFLGCELRAEQSGRRQHRYRRRPGSLERSL